jgi:predicted molibdopterin-dependent oxidoreductase YjgC
VQRLRQAVPHAGEVRPGREVLAELSARAGVDEAPPDASEVAAAMARAVPFYGGLTPEEIGGRGVRWPEREAAAALGREELSEDPLEPPPPAFEGLRLADAPTLWTGPEVRHSRPLEFLEARPTATLSPADAARLGLESGDDVEVASEGERVTAVAAVRTGVPAGAVFLSPQWRLREGPAELRAGAPAGVAP